MALKNFLSSISMTVNNSRSWRKDEALSMALNRNFQSDRGEEIRTLIIEMYTKVLTLFLRLAKEVWKQVFLFFSYFLWPLFSQKFNY